MAGQLDAKMYIMGPLPSFVIDIILLPGFGLNEKGKKILCIPS